MKTIKIYRGDRPICGDGCCHESYISVEVDDVEILDKEWGDMEDAIKAIAKHLGTEVEVKIISL